MQLSSFIWRFLIQQRWKFLFCTLLSFTWSIDSTVWPYILRLAVDALTQFEANRAAVWPALTLPIIYGVSLMAGVEIAFRCQGFLLARALPKLEADIRMQMFDHVQRHSPQYFNTHFAGELANKITDMTTHVTTLVTNTIWLLLPSIASSALTLLFFYQISPLFAGLFSCILAVYLLICYLFSKKCAQYEDDHGEVRSALVGKIVDSLTNNFAVNLFFRFKGEKARAMQAQIGEQKSNYLAKRSVEMMRLAISVTFFFGSLLIEAIMLYFWTQGKLSTGEIIQIFNTLWNMVMTLWITGTTLPAIYQSYGLARQALRVMHHPQDILDHPGAKPLVVSEGKIRFEGVSFKYGEKQLFENKSVDIGGGEKVGLVGYSGAGKSTFVNLILRFFQVEQGRILIDGQEIARVTLESLRNQVALIPQDPLLFHRTLEENIRFGKIDATAEEVKDAARRAHCHEFITGRPQGYDTLVGERGTKLSGGERQRIAIARAILANAPILILDEATSALDSVTERCIQESLENLMHNRTTLVIAHRLSTLAKMDRLLVFDKGKIVEMGSHEELLSRGGHYAHMWRMQAGGFLPES
ncbi:MAG: ABC transporter ATP-binding protein [Verrucomicrobia bacterium]|nr:ABC transporter ATP-binding protein [Verrucomicrobiota bacterium]